MKSKFLLLILFLCLGQATSALASDSYLCIGSKITGFVYDNNIKACRSITEESYNIYIVEKHKNAKYIWGVRKLGENSINYLCNKDFNEFGYLSCDFTGSFRMYKQNLIFLNSYLEDFCYSADVNEQLSPEAGRSVPFIEIGRCHPF